MIKVTHIESTKKRYKKLYGMCVEDIYRQRKTLFKEILGIGITYRRGAYIYIYYKVTSS